MKKIFVFLLFVSSITCFSQTYNGATTKITRIDSLENTVQKETIEVNVLFELKLNKEESYLVSLTDDNVFMESVEVIDKISKGNSIYYHLLLDQELECIVEIEKDIITNVMVYEDDLIFIYS